MRVGVDGVMLAVNDAALGLLDAPELAGLLGRPIAERISPEQVAHWPEFAARVWANGAGSFECSLLDRAGVGRPTLMQAVALRDHYDGIDSLLVSARDVSAPRELERSLHESEGELATLNAVRAELEAARAREQVLVARLAEVETERDSRDELLRQSEQAREKIEAFHLKERAPLQALAEQQQLALLEQERKYRDLVKRLQAELAQAIAEQQSLRTANEALAADRTRSLSEEQQQALVEQERAHQEAVADLQSQLAGALAGQETLRSQLAQLVADHEAALRATGDTQAAEQARFAEQQRTALLEQEQTYRQLVSDLEARLAQSVAEQQELRAANETLIADQARTLSEQQQLALLEQEREHRELVAGLHQQLAKAASEQESIRAASETLVADQARLFAEQRQAFHDQEQGQLELLSRVQAQLAESIAEREALRAANDALIADQARTLSEQQQVALQEQERAHREVLGALEAQLAQTFVDHEAQLARAAAEREALLARTIADHQAQLARAIAEHEERFSNAVTERDARIAQLGADHESGLAQISAAYDARLARVSADHESQLAQAAAAHELLRAAHDALAADRAQLLAEHAAGRQELERALAAAEQHTEARLVRQDQEIADLRRQLSYAEADREALGIVLERGEKARSEFESELVHARADAAVVRQQLNELVERHEQRQEEMLILQQRLASGARESERLAEQLEQQDVQTAELRAQLTDGRAENKRLQMLLAESEAHQMRLTADYAADRLRAKREVAEAMVEQNRMMKSLVDDNVELRHLRESARALELLAAIGRLAREIGAELHETIDQLNAHSTSLLTLTPLDAAHRAGVETLRLDALRAAGLARQLTQPDTRVPSTGSEGAADAVAGSLAE